MNWSRTDNPRVWAASDGHHYAMAEEREFGEGGFIGWIYARPLQLPLLGEASPERVVGTARWGLDNEAALRQCIRRFDEEATLPPREGGLHQLASKEREVRS